ncbi:MAG: hypothetical protein ACRBBP_03595 [Bdellovibrionales bacterium]
MVGMNDKPIKPNKKISSFFYENKLYEFSQKELSEADRLKMKEMAEEVPEAKYEIGGVLLGLEYLGKLRGISLEVKDIDYENMGKRSGLQKGLNLALFILLTIIFSVSGYYVLNILLSGVSN